MKPVLKTCLSCKQKYDLVERSKVETNIPEKFRLYYDYCLECQNKGTK